MKEDMDEKKQAFEKLGGRNILMKINKIFYDKVYAHPWISQFFKDVPQDVIESQQTDFMTSTLGGGNVYLGKLPVPAHKHMFISEELFDLRQRLLNEALDEAQACEELKAKWNKIDEAFRSKLVKKSISECEKRFRSDEILFFKNPEEKKAC